MSDEGASVGGVSDEGVGARVAAALEALREALRARHGWTWLELAAHVEPTARRIELSGEVAVGRLRARALEVARAAAPGWAVAAGRVRPMAGGTWHALRAPAVLLAERAGVGPRRVATEVRVEDGPLQRLGAVEDALVVRGRDGTVGWLAPDEPTAAAPTAEALLGPPIAALRLSGPRGDDPVALVHAARQWLGAPYRLGGSREGGVDCSGLMQRLVHQQLGVLLPRHSSDQLHVAPVPGPGPGVGDLSFMWSDREGRCHVGLGTGSTVIHASLSRRRVVEDAREAFLHGTLRSMHVPFAALVSWGRRMAGHPSLVAAGFELGCEPTEVAAQGSSPPDSRSA